jgi:hypothetical protein
MKRFVGLCALLLTACATPNPSYDPLAKETAARIVGKRIAEVVTRGAADRSIGMIPVAGIWVSLSSSGNNAQIPIYEYTVQEADGSQTRVYSEYFAYEPGHCVVLFKSEKPTYPRIAPGSNCQ